VVIGDVVILVVMLVVVMVVMLVVFGVDDCGVLRSCTGGSANHDSHVTQVLLYTPNDTSTYLLMDVFSLQTTGKSLNESSVIIGFSSGDEMQQYYEDNDHAVWCGVSTHTLLSNLRSIYCFLDKH
jgi:hypothetical protein